MLQEVAARRPHTYASRRPLATLVHEEEWNGTGGPNNYVQTGDLQMPRAPCPTQENNPHVVRTYVRTCTPQVGYLYSSFDMLYVPGMYERESTAQQQQPRKNNENEAEIPGGGEKTSPLM